LGGLAHRRDGRRLDLRFRVNAAWVVVGAAAAGRLLGVLA